MTSLSEKIANLPPGPGVYIFKGPDGQALYVGKAANLRKRVGSYFQRPGQDAKTLAPWSSLKHPTGRAFLEQAADLDFIGTGTEREAFILEDNIVKELHPRYNVRLRDDKSYLHLRLALEEEFPVLEIVRRVRRDKALYFGPFPSAKSLRETVKILRKIFPIRTNLDTKFTHLPPPEEADRDAYREAVHQVILFLEGRSEELLGRLRRRMAEEAGRMNFEAAARIRDQVEHISRVAEKQKVVSREKLDQDVVGFVRSGGQSSAYLLFVRGGKLIGGRGFHLPPLDLPGGEVLASFLLRFYTGGRFVPRRILVPQPLPDQTSMEGRLAEVAGKKVEIIVPARGRKKDLVDMARENAADFLLAEGRGAQQKIEILQALRETLDLQNLPRRIEGFDISNLRGGYAAGSLVCFVEGKPAKERYRHFKIQTVSGADDYAMMGEVLRRRYGKTAEEKDLPDLILVDGGQGQLSVARQVLQELGIHNVDLLALAKEGDEKRGAGAAAERSREKIFHPRHEEPFMLPPDSPVLHLLDAVRDEAHRFAIALHKKIRGKGAIRSLLREVPGIGPARQKALLNYFGTVERIRQASLEELARAPKMNPASARAVYDFLHPPNKNTNPKF